MTNTNIITNTFREHPQPAPLETLWPLRLLIRVIRDMTWPTKRQWQRQRQWQLKNTIKELETFETLITFLTIENNNLNIHSNPWIKSDRDSIRNSCDVLDEFWNVFIIRAVVRVWNKMHNETNVHLFSTFGFIILQSCFIPILSPSNWWWQLEIMWIKRNIFNELYIWFQNSPIFLKIPCLSAALNWRWPKHFYFLSPRAEEEKQECGSFCKSPITTFL